MSLAVLADGRGPLVALLPSLGRDAHDFEDLARRLAAGGCRVLRVQPAGIDSPLPPPGATLFDLAADVTAAIEAERAGPAVIAGHAFGSWVARAAATRRPDLVRAVALIAASRKGPIDPQIRPSISACFDATLPEEDRLAHLRRAFFAPGNDPRSFLGGWHADVARVQREAGAAVPQDDWWRAGGVPMLDLVAAQDALVPPDRRYELRDELGAQVTVEIVEGAGHALVPERPDEVAAALRRFLRTVGHLP